MSQTLSLRATSVAASAAFLGLAVFAALSVSITLRATTAGPMVAPVTAFRETPPPPVAPVRPIVRPPPSAQAEPSDQPAPPPPDAVEADAAPMETAYDPGPPVISTPHWLRRPRDLERYYPARALQREIQGAAVLDCLVNTDGYLTCVVMSETPQGWGFGAAALNIAGDYRMSPALRDGVAVEARYRMYVPFRVE